MSLLRPQDTHEGTAYDSQEDESRLKHVMLGRAELVFEIEDGVEWLYSALVPELEDDLHRGAVKLELRTGSVRLQIEGEDVASLRAALNTWIRLVKIGSEMLKV